MAADPIDAKIAGLGDWRGDMLAKLRALIRVELAASIPFAH